MKGLKCTTSNCEFNKGCHCEAGVINVGANAICKTRMKKHFEDIDEEYKDLEIAEEFDYADNDDVLIECDAIKCKYNKDHVCTCEKVSIKDSILGAKCVSKDID